MLGLSEELKRIHLSDKLFWDVLTKLESDFCDGRRSALFEVITLCATFQAVIPDWATDEICKAENYLNSGRYEDLNEFFGTPSLPRGKAETNKKKREQRLKKNEEIVISALAHHRWQGGSLDADTGLGAVAEDLGIPRRDVQEIYNKNKEVIISITRNNPTPEGIMRAQYPPTKRSGRSILPETNDWDIKEIN